MKKTIKKFIKLCLSPVLFLNKKVMETNWYKNVIPDLDNYPTNDWYRKHLERNYDFVVIGSSTGVYDFDLSVSGKKSFNWSMQPLAMEYSIKVLMNFFSILKKGGTVVIVFSPFSSLSVLGKQGKTTDDRFFHLLDKTLVNDYSEVSMRRKYPLIYQPIISLKRLIKDVPPKKEKRICKICLSTEEFVRDADNWIRGWKREFNILDLDAPLTDENVTAQDKRAKVIQQIIDFCLERDLRTILVMPPMHEALASKFSDAFRETYINSFMVQFSKQGIPFYNYIDSKDFSGDKYYSNSYFMNEEGAKAFTKTFLEDSRLI